MSTYGDTYQFLHIPFPKDGSPEELRRYATRVNNEFAALYAKLYGYVDFKNLSADARKIINSKLSSSDMANYSTIQQTSEAITQAVENLNLGQYATLVVMASAITAALADTSGTTKVSITAADGLKITQSNLGTYFQVNAEKAGFYRVSDDLPIAYLGSENGAGYFATNMIRDPEVDSNFKIWISSLFGWSMRFNVSGTDYGGFHIPARFMPRRLLLDVDQLNGRLSPNAGVRFGAISAFDFLIGGVDTSPTVFISGNILPETNDQFTLGSGANSARWNRLYCTESPSVSSDRRIKKDIKPLGVLGLLKRLVPKRFRMKANDKKLHFGFIAQEVQEAIRGTDYEDANLFDGDNPEHLALCYDELITVLVEGWQEHEARIDALEARLTALEGKA